MKKILTIAALALTIVACSNDIDEQPVEQPAKTDGMVTITAKLAPKSDAGTRAVALGKDVNDKDIIKVTWAQNETLRLLCGTYSTTATIQSVDAGTGEATISFTIDAAADGQNCTIVYPASAAKADDSGVKDAATLLAAQDGTLNANLDVRVGAGTIHTATPSLSVTTQPAAQFAIFKFTTKNYDASATINVSPLTITIGTQDYVITPASATSELYVALPAVSSQTVSFSGTVGSMPYLCSKTGISFDAGKFYQSTLKMLPQGAISGKYTINSFGKKVYFSQGNLQAITTDRNNWTWSFATNQWDCIGNATANTKINGNGTVSQNGTVDLFGWVGDRTNYFSGVAQYGISNSTTINYYCNSQDNGLMCDWGRLAITNGGNTAISGWFTLSYREWSWLFNSRTSGSTVKSTSNARYTFATINNDVNGGVNGIILFPDGVTFADSEATWGTINSESDWGTKCSTAQWAALAAKGCVFLPLTGSRNGSTITSTDFGHYWSSSICGANDYQKAYCVLFKSGLLTINYPQLRFYGCSVRLVRDAE